MANATLNPIYERLNNAPAFHPLTAETFADWSMEAGDIVTISRDGNTYMSPVGTSRMVWRGSQQISIDSTGTREREPISKVSRKKFSRGGGTANNNAFFYNEIFSDDGEVHSVVQQTASTFSVEVSKRARVFEYYEDPVRHGETVSPGDFWIKTNNVETWDEFTRVSWVYGSDFDWNDYKGAIVYVRTEYNTWRMVSNQQILLDHSTKIDQDENHISLIAQDIQRIDGNVEKNYAELKVESDRISSEVISTRENLASRIDQTASSIRSEVSTLDGQLSSRITQTASSIRSEVSNSYAGLSSSITQTASSIRSEVSSSYNGLSSSITQTASSIRSEVSNSYAGLSSSITQTASSIRSEVSDSYSGLSTTITQTSSTFSVEVGKRARVFISYEDPVRMGETVSKGDFWVKTNDIETWDEFHGVDWSYSSTFNWNDYKGCITYIRTEQGTWRLLTNQQEILDHSTRIDQDEDHISLIAQDVQRVDGNVQKNYAEFRVTSQAISADVIDTRNNLASNITQTASSIRSEVSTLDGQFSSRITQTASSIRSEVSTKEYGLSSSITQTASSIRSEVSDSYSGLSSRITQESDRISLVVEGTGDKAKIKPASIVAAINDGESSIVISATHINLDGYVKATDITSDYINSKIAGITQINGLSAKFSGNVYASQFYLPKSNLSVPVSSAVRYMQIIESGDGYKLQKKSLLEDEWQDVGTFSRATSLSGDWGSGDDEGKYVVTASPQGNKYKYSPSMRLNGSTQASNFSAEIYTVSGQTAIARKSVYGYMVLTSNGSSSYVDVNTSSDGSGTSVARLSVGSIYTSGTTAGRTAGYAEGKADYEPTKLYYDTSTYSVYAENADGKVVISDDNIGVNIRNAGYNLDHSMFIGDVNSAAVTTYTLNPGNSVELWPGFKKTDNTYQWGTKVTVTAASPSIDIPTAQIYTTDKQPSGATLLTTLKTKYEQAKADSDFVVFQVKCGNTTKTYYMEP